MHVYLSLSMPIPQAEQVLYLHPVKLNYMQAMPQATTITYIKVNPKLIRIINSANKYVGAFAPHISLGCLTFMKHGGQNLHVACPKWGIVVINVNRGNRLRVAKSADREVGLLSLGLRYNI